MVGAQAYSSPKFDNLRLITTVSRNKDAKSNTFPLGGVMSRGVLILSVVCCAQFALLLLFYFKADARSQDSQTSNFPTSIESYPHSVARSNDPIRAGSEKQLITEHRLRQIIQEELQSHLGQRDLNGSQEEAQLSAGRDADGAVAAAQRDFVLGKLDYYSSVGSISSAEMAQLQMEIVKLDESGRTEMMSRLNRALNSGALKGNL